MDRNVNSPDFDENRDHPILSVSDYRFLADPAVEQDWSRQQRSNYRQRVRHRTRAALYDLALIFRHTSPEFVGSILSPDAVDGDEWLNEVYPSMQDTLALLFASFYGRDLADEQHLYIDDLVNEALHRALDSAGRELREYQSMQYRDEPRDMAGLRKRLLDGQRLTYDEYEALAARGLPEDIKELATVQLAGVGSDGEG